MPDPLTVIRTPHSRNPWRLAWRGQPLDSAYCWPTRRAAEAIRQQLLPLADWTRHPATWDAATHDQVLSLLETCDNAITLRWLHAQQLTGECYA